MFEAVKFPFFVIIFFSVLATVVQTILGQCYFSSVVLNVYQKKHEHIRCKVQIVITGFN